MSRRLLILRVKLILIMQSKTNKYIKSNNKQPKITMTLFRCEMNSYILVHGILILPQCKTFI